MEEAKYTKGPWKVCKQFSHQGFIEVEHCDRHTKGAASLVVARVTCRESWRVEQEVNALLIAAAPDLLEQLQESTDMLIRIMEAQDWGAIEDQIKDNQQAIAKALGSQS